MKTHMKQKTFETMTLAEREEQILRAEESVWQYSNREALVLFRLMRETGIRLGDLVDLEQDNLQGRELRVVERKYGATKLYQYTDGSFPVISEETADMLAPGEDGKFFHHNREHYIRLFRRAIPDKEFSYHYIRRYVLDKRRMSR